MPDVIRSCAVRVFKAPLKRPFVTALGRKTASVNVGVTLCLSSGARGYGEASSSLVFARLRPARLAAAIASLGRRLRGRDALEHRAVVEEAWRRCAKAAPAAAAFECALLEAVAASKGLTLARWFGGRLKTLESDITLSAWADPVQEEAAAREAVREGFRWLKIKVGGRFDDDLARVRAARRALPRARLILDGNQGLTPASALRLVEACLEDGADVRLLEQPLPVADDAKMPALSRRCPVPIALDESCRTPADAARLAAADAAGAFNVKVAKSGLLRSLEIMAVARAAGLRLMIGCMTETGAGLSPSVHFALGTGAFAFVDLDADHLLSGPQERRGWRRDGPRLSLD